MAKNRKISPNIKSSVLSKLNTEGYSITKIAESHGISRAVIYAWIKELQAAITQQVSNTNSSLKNSFVEVALIDDQTYQNSNLQKVSLKFNDFSLFIEGNISTTKLLSSSKHFDPHS